MKKVEQWRYCPSKDNPGDDASRGLKPSDLTNDCRWLVGPSFLKDSESNSPRTNLTTNIDGDSEILENVQSNVLTEIKNR